MYADLASRCDKDLLTRLKDPSIASRARNSIISSCPGEENRELVVMVRVSPKPGSRRREMLEGLTSVASVFYSLLPASRPTLDVIENM